jgi:hypothetical protein
LAIGMALTFMDRFGARLFGLSAIAFAAALIALVACASNATNAGSGNSSSPDSAAGTTSPEIPCDAGATCTAAASLGTLSGDTEAGVLTAEGTTSSFVHVQVTEDNSDWGGRPLRLAAILTAPSTAGFELHAFFDVSPRNDAGLDCVDEVGRAVGTDGGSRLDLVWGDSDSGANGYDDGRTVALEVRHTAGACHADAPWHLELHGN